LYDYGNSYFSFVDLVANDADIGAKIMEGEKEEEMSPTGYRRLITRTRPDSPADINSEIARVLREVITSEFEATGGNWRALPPPTLTGQTANIGPHRTTGNVLLGKVMNFDKKYIPF